MKTKNYSLTAVIILCTGFFLNPACPPKPPAEGGPPADQVNAVRSFLGQNRRFVWIVPTEPLTGDFAGFEKRGFESLRQELMKNSQSQIVNGNVLNAVWGQNASLASFSKAVIADPSAISGKIPVEEILKQTGAQALLVIVFTTPPSTQCINADSFGTQKDRETRIPITGIFYKSSKESIQMSFNMPDRATKKTTTCPSPEEGITQAGLRVARYLGAFLP